MHRFDISMAIGLIVLCSACSSTDQDRANREAQAAKEKADRALHEAGREAKQLGREAKAEAKSLGNQIDHSLQGTGSEGTRGSASADQKLDDAGRKLRSAGETAAVKLDRAALIAKVKSKLAADVGLSTVPGIEVEAAGDVITLTGTVSSAQQKEEARRTAAQVDGVSRVVDRLQVSQP